MTPYRRVSSQNVEGMNWVAMARRAPLAIAPPMVIINPEGW